MVKIPTSFVTMNAESGASISGVMMRSHFYNVFEETLNLSTFN
jgi:hypothetical protein